MNPSTTRSHRRLLLLLAFAAGCAGTPPPSPSADHAAALPRVTGIGGVFFKAQDAPALRAWYRQHLGIDVQDWGGAAFTWTDGAGRPVAGTTVWSVFSAQSEQFAPSSAQFMINYRVRDLDALVAALREEGCAILDEVEDAEYGKFAWILDPEGNKVELWQPPVDR